MVLAESPQRLRVAAAHPSLARRDPAAAGPLRRARVPSHDPRHPRSDPSEVQ